MNNTVIYPGTFDPVTNGHIDLIMRAKKIFPKIIIAVSNNYKNTYFSFTTRIKLLQESLRETSFLSIVGFDTLLSDFAKKNKSYIILRSIRTSVDYEYELRMAYMNKKLLPLIETIFLMPSEKFLFLSSSIVKEIVAFGGNINSFVPHAVVKAFNNKY